MNKSIHIPKKDNSMFNTASTKTAESIISPPKSGIVNAMGVYVTTGTKGYGKDNEQEEIDEYNKLVADGFIDPLFKEDFKIAHGLLIVRAFEIDVVNSKGISTPRVIAQPYLSSKDGLDPKRTISNPSPYKNIALVVAGEDPNYPVGSYVIMRPELVKHVYDRTTESYVVPNRFVFDISSIMSGEGKFNYESISKREKGYFLIRSFDVIAGTSNIVKKLNEINETV